MTTMHTLPMYRDAVPDGWHRVTGPGGFERWHLEAADVSKELRLSVTVGQGYMADADYLRRYLAYRRRPTRCSPPVAQDHPWVAVSIERSGRPLVQWTRPLDPGRWAARHDALDMTAGPLKLRRDASGALQLDIDDLPAMRLAVRFAPVLRGRPVPLSLPAPGLHAPVTEPLCIVTGEIEWPAPRPRQMQIEGWGGHDHLFATGPLWLRLRRWMRGWVCGEGRAAAFQVSWLRDDGAPVEAEVLTADASGERVEPVAVIETGETDRAGMPAPLQLGDALHLTRPRLIGPAGDCPRIAYDVIGRAGTGVAVCIIATPPVGRWMRIGHRRR